MKILTNAGADVNVVVRDRSILMHVVEANHMLLAQVLITAGANVNFRDANGDTALRIARRYEYFDLDLMLVQAGGRL
jgi:ankyrin repeat protein